MANEAMEVDQPPRKNGSKSSDKAGHMPWLVQYFKCDINVATL